MAAPREIRVFISSTFRDLQEEREHLVKKVFPEIRVLCRQRGIVFTEIDLRWGLTEEEGMQGRIVRACLEGIDRCRPYFLGIVGDRYGWTPSMAEIYKDKNLVASYPWVEEAVADRWSLIEMEYFHGALHAPQHATGAYFYIRREGRHPFHHAASESVGTEQVHATTAINHSDPRIERLIERVRSSGLPMREFRGPATLGEQVYEDLCELIERDFADGDQTTLERERRSHESFAESRRRAYIPNFTCLHHLDVHVESDLSPLVVISPSGYGKSALLAYWVERRRGRHPDEFIVVHHIGIGEGSDRGFEIARRIMLEIADRIQTVEPIPDEPQRIVESLTEWLALLGNEKLLVIIDGTNQMPVEDRDLAWLPDHLPENLRLIVSTNQPTELLHCHPSWRRLTLESLNVQEREALVVRYLNEFNKSLAPNQIRRISQATQSAHPLYLRVLLEELRLHGRLDGLDTLIEHYLSAYDTASLFRLVLERIEEDFGTRRVREIMQLLWASREGLAEGEIAELTETSRSNLPIFLSALDYHLLRRADLYSFFHSYLAEAVEQRYLKSFEEKQAVHVKLGKYFSMLSVSPRRLDEEPWQWERAKAWDELKDCLTHPEMFLALACDDRKYALLGYWNRLEDRHELLTNYKEIIRTNKSQNAEVRLLVPEILQTLGRLLTDAGKYSEAEPILRMALDQSRRHGFNERASGISALESLAALYYHTGNNVRAARLLQRAIDDSIMAEGEESPRVVAALSTLGAVLYNLGNYTQQEECLRRALQIEESLLGRERTRHAELLNNLATALFQQGRRSEALEIFLQALGINRIRYGAQHPEVAANLGNISVVYSLIGEITRAEECVREAIAINLKFRGPRHPATLLQYGSLATILGHQRRYTEAETLLTTLLATCHESLGGDHPFTVDTTSSLATHYYQVGQFAQAATLYQAVLTCRRTQLGDQHPSTVAVMNRYQEVLERISPELGGQ